MSYHAPRLIVRTPPPFRNTPSTKYCIVSYFEVHPFYLFVFQIRLVSLAGWCHCVLYGSILATTRQQSEKNNDPVTAVSCFEVYISLPLLSLCTHKNDKRAHFLPGITRNCAKKRPYFQGHYSYPSRKMFTMHRETTTGDEKHRQRDEGSPCAPRLLSFSWRKTDRNGAVMVERGNVEGSRFLPETEHSRLGCRKERR